MNKDEKILIALSFVALVCVVLWQRKAIDAIAPNPLNEVGQSLTPENSNMEKGPQWLVANDPYGFMPPINNFLPTITIGQEGQTVQNPLQFIKRMGIFSKGTS